MGKHNRFKLETHDEIKIPTPEEIEEYERRLIEHEAFLIVQENEAALKKSRNKSEYIDYSNKKN